MKAEKQLIEWKNDMEEKSKLYQIDSAFYELLNMITIGILIVQQSIERKENKGGFVKIDLKSNNRNN
jgi:L-aspartate oxidase